MTTHATTARRTGFRTAVAALALLTPALLAGCTSGPDTASGSTDTPAADARSASAQLGSCLRDAGFDVDDPDLSEVVVIAAPKGSDPDAYEKAFSTCSATLPGEFGEIGQAPDADEAAALQKSGLKVAQCVRDKGFSDFADPVGGEFAPGRTGPEGEAEALAFDACWTEFGPDASGDDE
jgi:hypothetical protein